MCLNLKRAVAAHQVVQINAITVRVICATARRYNSTRTHTQIPTTTKKNESILFVKFTLAHAVWQS